MNITHFALNNKLKPFAQKNTGINLAGKRKNI